MSGGDAKEMQAWSMPGYSLPVYPFTMPPELGGKDPGTYPVVIVGAGLSGLTLAVELGQRGIPTVVLDDDNTVGAAGISSRGVCYAKRSLEIFRKLGVAQRIVDKGVLWRIGRVLRQSQELYSFDLQAEAQSQHPPFVNLQQFYVEEYLVDRISELPSVDLRWLHRVTGVKQDDDAAIIKVETEAGDYELRAKWLVAADGSQSIVRDSLGLVEPPNYFDDLWCIADLRTPLHMAAERRVWIAADFNDGGVVFFHRMADGICRFDFQIGHYADPDAHATREAITRRLRLALGADVEFDLVWAGTWRFKHRMMQRFRHGRVLFAGDAAHELPPFGARGGNGGIQDANNLGWKLAMVANGEAAAELLDTYDDERRDAATENIRQASHSALFLSPETKGQKLFREAVCDLGTRAPHIRQMINTGRLSVANVYPPGPLVIADDDVFAAGPGPGSALLDAPVDSAPASHLVAAVPDTFTALHFVPDDAPSKWTAPRVTLGGRAVPSVRIVRQGARAAVGDWVDSTGELFALYDGDAGATYVLRPDGHVMCRSREPSLDLPWRFDAPAHQLAGVA